MIHTGLIGSVTLLLLFQPVRAQEADDILERTAATYRTLEQYHFAGTINVHLQSGAMEQGMDLLVEMAAQAPGRAFFQIDSPVMKMTYVTDGDTSWVYLPARHQHTKQAGTLTLRPDVPDLLNTYKTIDTRAASVHLLGEDSVEVAGRSYPSYVLAVEHTPRSTPDGPDSTRQTLWIDKERLLVLRDETQEHVPSSPFGGPVTIREATVFTTVQVEAPPPDSFFTFRPPATSEEVASLDLFGPPSQRGLRGQPAKDFVLPTLSGEQVRLSDLSGSVVLLNFWATWCGPCRSEMAALERLHREFADEGLVVLAIDLAEPTDEVAAYIDAGGFTFPVLLDADGAVTDLYEAFSIPTTYIIDREGTIVHQLIGARPEGEFRSALQDVGLD